LTVLKVKQKKKIVIHAVRSFSHASPKEKREGRKRPRSTHHNPFTQPLASQTFQEEEEEENHNK